jgi:low temperature requirement protein LtrA
MTDARAGAAGPPDAPAAASQARSASPAPADGGEQAGDRDPPAEQAGRVPPGNGCLAGGADRPGEEPPLRVTTLEIFFDLVFAFTLTQLTSVLATRLSWLTVLQVLLIFGLLWWMYGAYAWLTNSRPPVHTAERLPLLAGMAGFLVVGLAIPRGFGSYGVVLGLGYLVVVLVHAVLYYRVNANILRVAPFNIASALLVIVAGLLHNRFGTADLAAYLLWVLALAVQLGSPLIVRPAGLFELRASHFSERHSALLIVAIGESVAAVGIAATGPLSRQGPVRWQLLAISVLGLVVAAMLWWIAFGTGDQERSERMLGEASSERRTELALQALFYGFIPLLLGLIGVAAGVFRAVVEAAGTPGADTARAAHAAVLAAGAALFLTGDVIARRLMSLGPVRWRVAAAVAALATTVIGAFAGLEVQLVVVAVVLLAPLIAERQPAGERAADADAAG